MSSVLIIGGGITGLQAAQNLSQVGVEVVLVEQSDQLGGNLKALGSTFPEGRLAPELIASRVNGINGSPQVTVLTDAEITSLSGEYPQFKAGIKTSGGNKEVESSIGYSDNGFSPLQSHGHETLWFWKTPRCDYRT